MVILYSTGCPKCNLLEKRLTASNIDYKISDDVEILIEKGFQSAPVLQINDEYLDYASAMRKLRDYERGEGVFA